MSAIVWADVLGIAPELAAITISGQTAILALANSVLDTTVWGGEDSPQLRMGRLNYAAHFASMSMRRGDGGATTSSSAGGLSVAYANTDFGSHSTLQTTSYGQMYMALARSRGMARAGLSLAGIPGYPVDPGWDG
jgi:Protein of unknown function (DUF4054)